jgi:hypothetical protein
VAASSTEIDPDGALVRMRVETSRWQMSMTSEFSPGGDCHKAVNGVPQWERQKFVPARPVSIGSAKTSFNAPPAKARFLTATCRASRSTRNGSGTWPEEASNDG